MRFFGDVPASAHPRISSPSPSRRSRGVGGWPLPPLAIVVLALLSATGCREQAAPGGDQWEVERFIENGIEVVRTLQGSTWGEAAELVEEIRIGVLDGQEEYMFGRIQEVAPDGEGGVYVFDGQVPALRHYDAEGRYLRTLGGEGAGPGEYYDAALGLALLPDGRLLLRDPRNGRFTLYDRDGVAVEHWPLASGLFTSRATAVDTAGHVYARILTDPIEPGQPWPIGLLHLDNEGQVIDTILSPSIDGEPSGATGTFSPAKRWDLHPHGYLVVGVSDRYAIELRRPEGTLRIEKRAGRVAVHPEERAQHEARRQHMIRTQGESLAAEPPPIPRQKPFFRNIYAGEDGSIWVHRHEEATLREPDPDRPEPDPNAPPPLDWIEPTVFDVFEPDGTYLGRVTVPPRTSLRTFSTDVVWATRQGEFDELYLVRLRVVPPGNEGG